MAFLRGEVWLVDYPFSDHSTSKTRPAVILSTDEYHSLQPDIIVAALTSNLSGATGQFDYVLKDWGAAGVRLPSALKPIITTLSPSRAIHRIGALTPKDLSEIESRIRLSLGL